ncbi:MAG TPA: cob(I)yrinic acid a,c-diamide adenosyltransferase [bacterium]|nr:cob(I)yrinic acid a,c-diamide adenosyltransferase [bacterium]
MLHIYTGSGKGKTTAACGLILRMLGWKKHVFLAQFFKPWIVSGEIRALKKIPFFHYRNIPRPSLPGIANLRKKILKNNYALVVLDELMLALRWKIIRLEDIMNLIDEKREWVLTGRGATAGIKAAAHYVTEMKEIKHPYRKKIKARRGIEY